MLHRRLIAALLILGVVLSVTAQATPRILRAFNTRYPEAKEKLGNCQTCHTDTVPQMNAYGADLKKAGADFAKVDSIDSDWDGVLNIVEIKGLSRPGDQESKPDAKGQKKPVPDSSKAGGKK